MVRPRAAVFEAGPAHIQLYRLAAPVPFSDAGSGFSRQRCALLAGRKGASAERISAVELPLAQSGCCQGQRRSDRTFSAARTGRAQAAHAPLAARTPSTAQ